MNHFNKIANSWDSPEKIKLMKVLAKKTIEQISIKNKVNILDFGCGTGLFGLEFSHLASNLVGVDTSVGMIEVFNQKTKAKSNITSFNGDIKDFTTDLKFDLIISSMTFHHLENPELTLGLLTKFLSKEGQILIVDLTKEDGTFHSDSNKIGVHHHGFSEQEIKYWGSENNLSSTYTIINSIEKSNKKFDQFLAIFTL